MSALTVRWALLSKEAINPYDYEITATSHPDLREAFAKVLSAFTSGTSNHLALPRVSTSYFTDTRAGGNTPMVGLSLQERSSEQDGFRRGFTTTKFVCARWSDFYRARASYLSLYRAVRAADLSAQGSRPLTLKLDPYPAEVFSESVTPLARQAAALLLTRQQLCVTGTDHLPEESRLETRLAFLDTVAALLPYGFRSSLAVSTWTNSSVQHRIKLSFAAVAPDWAGELRWSDEGTQVEPVIDLPGDLPPEEQESDDAIWKRYGAYIAELNRLKEPALLEEAIGELLTAAKPLSLKQPADLEDAKALLVTAVTQAKKTLAPTTPPADPGPTEPVSTEPASTDPTSTDPTSTDPTSTDPTSTESGPPPSRHDDAPGQLVRLGAPPTSGMTLEDLVTAGLAGLSTNDWRGVKAAARACGGLQATAAARRQGRNAIVRHASAFQIQPPPALLPDVKSFVRAALRLVYGAEPTVQDVDDLAGDLGTAPSQPLLRAFETAFRPTAGGKVLLTCFLYGDPFGVKSFTVRDVITALTAEPHKHLLEIALLALKETHPTDARELLEEHRYLIDAVESSARESRRETYLFLLQRAYPNSLTTNDAEDIVAHTGYPPEYLMAAMRDASADHIDWGRVFARIAAVNDSQDSDGGDGPVRFLDRARAAVGRRIGRRRRQLPSWAGWCVAALATVLWIVTLVSDSRSAPAAGRSGPPAATSSSGAIATAPPVAPPSSTVPLPFPWPSYSAGPAKLRADPQLAEWISVMNSMDCRSIGRLEPAKAEAAGVYKGLQAACESTAFGTGRDRWAAARANADAWPKINDDDCKDQLAAKLLVGLVQSHRNNPDLLIELAPSQDQTPVICKNNSG